AIIASGHSLTRGMLWFHKLNPHTGSADGMFATAAWSAGEVARLGSICHCVLLKSGEWASQPEGDRRIVPHLTAGDLPCFLPPPAPRAAAHPPRAATWQPRRRAG